MADADLRFYFDPVCPFAWLTSQWVRTVAAQRHYRVEWRFISLRQVNAHVDYAAQFPPDYEAGHTAGLHLLRVAARARDEHGPGAVGRFYEALGALIHEREPGDGPELRATRELASLALSESGLPADGVDALDDPSWDEVIQAETDEALALTGKDVGTPILHFGPPDGLAFFGPVISRRPDPAHALELWDHVSALARFPGFAELKRSLRERPQLQSAGVKADEVGTLEDWHGGSRRQHR
jgi:hypothetical protein